MQLNEKITKDDRLTALREYLADEAFETPYGDYLVLTEDEADDLAVQNTKDILEDVGLEGLNIDITPYVEEDWFRYALEESNQFYAEDILSESDRTYDNRLVEECYSNGLISDDDFELDEDGKIDYTKCQLDSDELIERYTEYLNDKIKDPIEEFIFQYGQDYFDEIVIKNELVDLDDLAEEIVSLDGRGKSLATYDGEEREIKSNGEWFYIYRTN